MMIPKKITPDQIKLLEDGYIGQIRTMSERAMAWRKANPNLVVTIAWCYPPQTQICTTLRHAAAIGLVQANDAGAKLLLSMIDLNEEEPTITQVRAALEMEPGITST
jgi:hypothetical protein